MFDPSLFSEKNLNPQTTSTRKTAANAQLSACQATMDSEYDRYIVVSFVDVTLVLSIGDTVEEAVEI